MKNIQNRAIHFSFTFFIFSTFKKSIIICKNYNQTQFDPSPTSTSIISNKVKKYLVSMAKRLLTICQESNLRIYRFIVFLKSTLLSLRFNLCFLSWNTKFKLTKFRCKSGQIFFVCVLIKKTLEMKFTYLETTQDILELTIINDSNLKNIFKESW